MTNEPSEPTTPPNDHTSSSPILFSPASPTSSVTTGTSYEPSSDADTYLPTPAQRTSGTVNAGIEVVDISSTGTIHRLSIPATTHEATMPEPTVRTSNIPYDQRIILYFIKYSIISLIMITLAISMTLLLTWLLCTSVTMVCSTTTRIQTIIMDATIFIFACALTTELTCAMVFLISVALHRCILKSKREDQDTINMSTLTTRTSKHDHHYFKTKSLIFHSD